MKKDKEFEREDLAVDRDIQLDSDNKQQIVAYLETLFDVNEKFNLQLDSEAGEWVNMYGIYNPLSDFHTVECVISKDNSSESFFYTPTTAESALIKELIAEKIKEEFGQTPTEFVCDLAHQEEKAYLYYNRSGCDTRPSSAKFNRLKQYCQENGYTVDGSTSINAPMSRSGGELRSMVEYCKSRGIRRIVVDEMKDVADTPWETARILNHLQNNGLVLNVVHCDMVFGQQKTQGIETGEIEFGGM